MSKSVTIEEKIEKLLYAHGAKESNLAAKQIYEEYVKPLEFHIKDLKDYKFMYDNLNK